MIRSLTTAIVASLSAAGSLRAASFHITPHGSGVFSVHLDGTPHNSDFDTLFSLPGRERSFGPNSFGREHLSRNWTFLVTIVEPRL